MIRVRKVGGREESLYFCAPSVLTEVSTPLGEKIEV
jgi:hypothetical protein